MKNLRLCTRQKLNSTYFYLILLCSGLEFLQLNSEFYHCTKYLLISF